MSNTYGLCPKCGELKYLTRHHLYPLRFFPKQNKPASLFLCRACHDELERRIPYAEKLHREDYLQIARAFLADNEVCLAY